MKKFYSLLSILFFTAYAYAQNVGIGTTTPSTRLEVKKPIKSTVKISSESFNDTTQLIFSNKTTSNAGTDMIISSNREEGLRISSQSDITTQVKDTIMQITPQGNIGIGIANPAHVLDVKGNVNVTSDIKTNGLGGTAGAVLTNNGNGTMQWAEAKINGSVGFGTWGDCSTNNISEYNPVADATGALNDGFGFNVSISGNYAIVGAPFDDVGTNANQGSVSIYQFNGTKWVQIQKITDATGATDDNFGSSVSISGSYAIVGTNSDDVGTSVNQGSVSIYQLSAGTWVLMEKIIDATGAAGDNFGYSVSISGTHAIVGAKNDDVGVNYDQGSASIYQFNGTNWVQMQKITDATGAMDDLFGYSVSISGNRAIVGASNDDDINTDQGSVSIYKLSVGTWVLMQKITDAFSASYDNFGSSVSISGNYAIVGAAFDDVGANINQGSASIYKLSSGGIWGLMQKITEANGASADQFGYNVSISGNYAIVGANHNEIGSNISQGSASVYQSIGLNWQKVQQIIDPAGAAFDEFGTGSAIDGATKRFLIGANGYTGNSGKAVFGKLNF
jgi:FG-GAP repeat